MHLLLDSTSPAARRHETGFSFRAAAAFPTAALSTEYLATHFISVAMKRARSWTVSDTADVGNGVHQNKRLFRPLLESSVGNFTGSFSFSISSSSSTAPYSPNCEQRASRLCGRVCVAPLRPTRFARRRLQAFAAIDDIRWPYPDRLNWQAHEQDLWDSAHAHANWQKGAL